MWEGRTKNHMRKRRRFWVGFPVEEVFWEGKKGRVPRSESEEVGGSG